MLGWNRALWCILKHFCHMVLGFFQKYLSLKRSTFFTGAVLAFNHANWNRCFLVWYTSPKTLGDYSVTHDPQKEKNNSPCDVLLWYFLPIASRTSLSQVRTGWVKAPQGPRNLQMVSQSDENLVLWIFLAPMSLWFWSIHQVTKSFFARPPDLSVTRKWLKEKDSCVAGVFCTLRNQRIPAGRISCQRSRLSFGPKEGPFQLKDHSSGLLRPQHAAFPRLISGWNLGQLKW